MKVTMNEKNTKKEEEEYGMKDISMEKYWLVPRTFP